MQARTDCISEKTQKPAYMLWWELVQNKRVYYTKFKQTFIWPHDLILNVLLLKFAQNRNLG